MVKYIIFKLCQVSQKVWKFINCKYIVPSHLILSQRSSLIACSNVSKYDGKLLNGIVTNNFVYLACDVRVYYPQSH